MGTRLYSDYAADQAERVIANWILTGRYREGDQLPGIEQLTEELGVSYPTLSKAIGRLRVRRLVHIEPGEGVFVNSLNDFVGLDMLWPMISQCNEPWRRLVLICQFYDFIRPQLAEWAERAATKCTDEHLEWLEHFTLAIEERHRQKCTRSIVGNAEYQIARILATGAGNVCCTLLINVFEELYTSDLLVEGPEPIVASEVYRAILKALRARDGKEAGRLLEEALWTRELACIAELRKLGWTVHGLTMTRDGIEPEAA
jgi:DNA-binding FadR family transcriptional regulator